MSLSHHELFHNEAAIDANKVVAACRRLSVAMDSFDAAAAATIGVNRNDLRALNLLEDGPLSQAAIAAALKITRPSVTTLVDRLEASRMVRRLPDRNDRRSTLVELLPATWQAFERVYRPLGEHVLHLARGWDAEKIDFVTRALLELCAVFDEDAARTREKKSTGREHDGHRDPADFSQ